MSFIVELNSKASENTGGGGFYPQAYNEYIATITDIVAEKAGSYDIIKVKTLVENSKGETYEEDKNGPSIFKGDYFDANVSRLINAAVGSKENEGTLDPSIAETTTPDLSLLIGKKIGVDYQPQKKKPEFATTTRVITTDKVRGCYDTKKFDEWIELKKKAKQSGGSTPTPQNNVNPFANK